MPGDEVIKVGRVLPLEAVDQLTQCGSLDIQLLAELGVGDLQLAGKVGERAEGGEDGVQLLFGGEASLDVEKLDHVIELLKIISANSSNYVLCRPSPARLINFQPQWQRIPLANFSCSIAWYP